MSEGVWLRGGDGEVGLTLVYINERDKVLVEPISSELEVVKWSTQKVETTSAVEVLETQRILKWRERESTIAVQRNARRESYIPQSRSCSQTECRHPDPGLLCRIQTTAAKRGW